jgi:hypothetical protein
MKKHLPKLKFQILRSYLTTILLFLGSNVSIAQCWQNIQAGGW